MLQFLGDRLGLARLNDFGLLENRGFGGFSWWGCCIGLSRFPRAGIGIGIGIEICIGLVGCCSFGLGIVGCIDPFGFFGLNFYGIFFVSILFFNE